MVADLAKLSARILLVSLAALGPQRTDAVPFHLSHSGLLVKRNPAPDISRRMSRFHQLCEGRFAPTDGLKLGANFTFGAGVSTLQKPTLSWSPNQPERSSRGRRLTQ